MSDRHEGMRGLATAVRYTIAAMTPDERIEFIRMLMEGYCKHCGIKTDVCHCERDE